jgi:DNA invertase Pin-like site-specific DNA recombinase
VRTVIYARFSSDNQNPRSVADQVALCRERADREGWPVIAVFEDAAISGAAGIGENQRPGLNALLDLVEAGGIDQVLAESTDRVSRHVADAHLIRERIEFAGARLFTLFDGAVTPMVGLVKGFMDAQFRTDLAARVRRGQRGSIAEGRSSGGVSYGYRVANRIDERGRLVAGLREIDPARAAIVQRIFREFAAGISPRTIAGRLNTEGVPPPRRGYWHTTTISGDNKNGHGILRNRLYIGELVYGRTRNVINPKTRRHLMRPNSGEPLAEQQVPHLRIIGDDLWQQVQERLATARTMRPERQRRPKHLLSGLGVCGICGAPWTKCSSNFWGCSRFRNGRGCTNTRMIGSRGYERRVLAQLKAGMLAPEAVAAFVREYHRDFARRTSELARERAQIESNLDTVTRKVRRLLDAFTEGGSEFPEIRDMLSAARDEKERLTRALASMDALPEVVALHPRLDEEYRRQIEALETALATPEAAVEAVPRLRSMIARIVVTPGPKLRGVQLEVIRQLDEVLRFAGEQAPRRQGRS